MTGTLANLPSKTDNNKGLINSEWLECVECRSQFNINEVKYFCSCGGLIAVERNAANFNFVTPELLQQRIQSQIPHDQSGVWRFREAVLNLPEQHMITHPEGGTHLYFREALCRFGGVEDILFKHEGENPTGSFKDRGMTVAISKSHHLGRRYVACASTGNTSAALAAYAAQSGQKSVVFIPAGKIAMGKLSQAVGYGAKILAIKGDFDAAMTLVQQAAVDLDLYLVNSLNPFRLEGQKTIIFETLFQLKGARASDPIPDWIVVPAGNLGNTSAFGKALQEAYKAGWISRLPKIAAIQAEGAHPFYNSFINNFKNLVPMSAETIATAIRIGNPVNWAKAKRAITQTAGLVEVVTDREIMQAKAAIDGAGLGCEPASAATLAGVKKLRAKGVMQESDRVVCILTGHILKDSEAILNSRQKDPQKNDQRDILGEVSPYGIITIDPDIGAVAKALKEP